MRGKIGVTESINSNSTNNSSHRNHNFAGLKYDL